MVLGGKDTPTEHASLTSHPRDTKRHVGGEVRGRDFASEARACVQGASVGLREVHEGFTSLSSSSLGGRSGYVGERVKSA